MCFKLFLSALLAVSISFVPLQAKNFHFSHRIIMGESSEPNQFPYMASLRQVIETVFVEEEYKHFCGAALISDRWVISAAHCLYGIRLNTANIRIIVGAYDFWEDGIVYKVQEIIQHEKFLGFYDSCASKENDISLLRTKMRVIFNASVQPIAIAKDWIEPNKNGVFAGFGVTGTSF